MERVSVSSGRRLGTQRRTGPAQPQEPCAADSQRGASCLPPLSQHLGHSLRRRHHRPPSGPCTTTQPAAGGLATEPHPTAPSVSRPSGGLSPLLSLPSALKPVPQDSTWLPESASCVACVPPCWPLRPVPFDVERGEGGGNLARALRGGPLCNPPAGALLGGEEDERLVPWARRALAAPLLPSSPLFPRLLLLRELEIAGTRRKLRGGPDNRKVGNRPRLSNLTEHLNHLRSY